MDLRKVFFSEEKKQKTFIFWRCALRQGTLQEIKVFWFFFSKKNFFLNCLAGWGQNA
jgi:hypothetical protein